MLKNLFLPIKLGNLELNNRIALSPMGIGSYNSDETITEEYIDFIRARSAGTGLVITTGTRVTEKYGKYKVNGCYNDKFLPGLSKLASAAKDKGSKIFLQIMALGPADPYEPFVPSLEIEEYQDFANGPIKPKQLNIGQIEEIVSEFAAAALRAKKTGFDGVELFGSEDGLISSFICPHFNNREDRYGQGLEGRLKFPVDIITAIKKECGNDFPIGFKFNAVYNIKNGIDLELGIKIAEMITQAGACYIHCWSFETFEKPMSAFKFVPMPNLYQPRNTLVGISAAYKNKLPGTIVMAVGGILKPDEADLIISEKKADIIAVARGFIAEEKWSNKSKNNIVLRPCIRCHVCHNEVAVNGKLIVCSVNPDVLGRIKPIKAAKAKKVLVIGGGPAGITAAVTASKRGHDVTLIEKNLKLGGKLIPGSAPDFKHEFKDLLSYLNYEIELTNIKIKTGLKANREIILNENPEILILALGAIQKYPDIEGINNPNLFEAIYAFENPGLFKGTDIAVVGGGDVGCEAALYLKENGCKSAIIIEILDKLMKEEIEHNSITLKKMLEDARIGIYTESKVSRINKNFIDFLIKDTEHIKHDIDFTIIATGYKEPCEELKNLSIENLESYVIGDSLKPGRLREAVTGGFNIGNNI